MEFVSLMAKAVLATMFLVAGGAKLADLDAFGSSVRLFVPSGIAARDIRWLAGGIALVELAVGAASLAWPLLRLLNVIVLALTCCFLGVSIHGYVFHRGHSCRCFGALSQRRFNPVSVGRNAVIVVVALIAVRNVRSTVIDLTTEETALLLAAGALLAMASFTAARSLRIGLRYGLVPR